MSENIQSIDECLAHCPCGVLMQDASGIIRVVNPALESMLGLSAEALLGCDRESLTVPVFRALLDGEGVVHLTGPGMSRDCWLRCGKVASQEDGRVMRFFEDLTEVRQLEQVIERLNRQVEDLTITDELTGLANQRALMRALNTQVTRSRRYRNPLSLAVVELQDESDPDGRFSDETILATSQHLRERLRWVDVIARWDHNHFFVILPETGLADGTELIRNISDRFPEAAPLAATTDKPLVLQFGVAEWTKGNDSRSLLERASEALNNSMPVTQ
ncbi:MAG: sensor domain-containing diguanylate cyclase [Gammaproteobacteria bacterium]|nr:sensor domain-containing diguanylate cyclase [Gammaproteobacteria bacterium]